MVCLTLLPPPPPPPQIITIDNTITVIEEVAVPVEVPIPVPHFTPVPVPVEVIREVEVFVPVPTNDWSDDDPLAQSFYVGDATGVFMSSVDVYFAEVDDEFKLCVEISNGRKTKTEKITLNA